MVIAGLTTLEASIIDLVGFGLPVVVKLSIWIRLHQPKVVHYMPPHGSDRYSQVIGSLHLGRAGRMGHFARLAFRPSWYSAQAAVEFRWRFRS